MVDLERLTSLLDRSAAELSLLRSQAPLGRTQLLSDPLHLDAAKYRLVVAIEALVDAAGHIIASEGLRRPISYADAFTVLAEAGFLTGETAVAAQLMARFRNVLVHGYAVVDDGRVVDVILERLDDLDRLRAELAAVALR